MSDEKILIRRSVASALLSISSTMVPYVRNKLCKVLVDIGRFDWPHFYPDYFNNIFQVGPLVFATKLPLLRSQKIRLIRTLRCLPRANLSIHFSKLINNHSTRLVGVLMLKTTSEEFISPKDDLCASRRKELKHLLNNLVPQMLTSLTGEQFEGVNFSSSHSKPDRCGIRFR